MCRYIVHQKIFKGKEGLGAKEAKAICTASESKVSKVIDPSESTVKLLKPKTTHIGKSYGVQIKINNDDDVFSLSAAQVEDFLKQDRLLYPHCRYYIREMRIHAYTQLLESYRSLTLQYMANAFGVSEEFIDK